MREHEVPTHVQAEDRVLLWFTFPQIVAMTAVCALAYGVYRYAPFGPSEVRMAAAVLFGLAGLAVVAGRIGGRRLPLVAADLLRFGLGARRYAGPPAQLVRSEPPAPAQPASSGPRPRRLLARRMRRVVRRRSRRRKEGERRNGRMPFRPHRLFGKRRRQGGEEPAEAQRAATQERDGRRLGRWRVLPAVAVMAVVLTALPVLPALAQDPGEEGWFSEEIEFQPPPLVQGRRLFVEGLAVSGEQAAVTLRAATDLDLTVRAYGGPEGRSLRFFGTAALDQGELSEYDLPLHGPSPSLVFSWEDELGQAGAVSLAGERLPWPLPAVTGELCVLRLVSLGWSAGAVEGTISSECVSATEEAVVLQTVAGHADVTTMALLEGEVVAVTGTVTVGAGTTETTVAFVAGGETRFRLPVAAGEAVHALAIEADLVASLSVALPPLVELTHVPRRVEQLTETATVSIPAFGDTVTETFTVPNEDGTFTEHTVTASCYVPASTVHQDVVFTVVHPERVEAEVVARSPIARSREESLSLTLSVGADDLFAALILPEPDPEPDPPTQTPVTGDELSDWFEQLGWEWVW